MKKYTYNQFLIIISFVLLSLFFWCVVYSEFISTIYDNLQYAPRLECPDQVVVVETEIGDLAEAKIGLSNGGKSLLRISNFRKGCACDALGRREGSKLVDFNSISLAPGESTEIIFIQKVRGEVGKDMVSNISFETNDPSKPTFSVSIRIPKITGGLTIVPDYLDIGYIPEGSDFESYLELFGDPAALNEIEKVLSTNPATIQTQFQSRSEISYQPINRFGKLFLGRVHVLVKGKNSNNINGFVQVFLKGRPDTPDKVEVFGKIVRPVETYPEVIVFPRQSEKGPVYQTNCTVRSPFRQPFTLEVSSCPVGISIEIDSKESKSVHNFIITVLEQSTQNQLLLNTRQNVSFVSLFNGKEFAFSIPIQWISGNE